MQTPQNQEEEPQKEVEPLPLEKLPACIIQQINPLSTQLANFTRLVQQFTTHPPLLIHQKKSYALSTGAKLQCDTKQ